MLGEARGEADEEFGCNSMKWGIIQKGQVTNKSM